MLCYLWSKDKSAIALGEGGSKSGSSRDLLVLGSGGQWGRADQGNQNPQVDREWLVTNHYALSGQWFSSTAQGTSENPFYQKRFQNSIAKHTYISFSTKIPSMLNHDTAQKEQWCHCSMFAQRLLRAAGTVLWKLTVTMHLCFSLLYPEGQDLFHLTIKSRVVNSAKYFWKSGWRSATGQLC